MPHEALVRLLHFTHVRQIPNLCAVAFSFKVACQEPTLWEYYCRLRWRSTEAPSLRSVMNKCGAYRFFRSRILAEASLSPMCMITEWLVTLDVWVREIHCHSFVHEAEACFGEHQHCAYDALSPLIAGFNFDLTEQPLALQTGDEDNHPWAFWEIAVSVVRKRDGAVAPLVRRSSPLSMLFGRYVICPFSSSTTLTPNDFRHLRPFLPCQMRFRNDISHRTVDEVRHLDDEGIICTFHTSLHVGKYSDLSNGIRLLPGNQFEVVTLLLGFEQVPVEGFFKRETDEYSRALNAYLRFEL